MSNERQVTYQINMGSTSHGEWRTASPAELYGRLFNLARRFVPPFAVLNDKLAAGIDRAGEHGIHLRWTPLQLTEAEYARFCDDLRASGREHRRVDSPPDIQSWDAWSAWIYTTQIEPTLAVERAPSTAREELALRRGYRKALATGDAETAARLCAEIRERFDPKFS